VHLLRGVLTARKSIGNQSTLQTATRHQKYNKSSSIQNNISNETKSVTQNLKQIIRPSQAGEPFGTHIKLEVMAGPHTIRSDQISQKADISPIMFEKGKLP